MTRAIPKGRITYGLVTAPATNAWLPVAAPNNIVEELPDLGLTGAVREGKRALPFKADVPFLF